VFQVVTTSTKAPTGQAGNKHTYKCHMHGPEIISSVAVDRRSGGTPGSGCTWTVQLVETKEGYFFTTAWNREIHVVAPPPGGIYGVISRGEF